MPRRAFSDAQEFEAFAREAEDLRQRHSTDGQASCCYCSVPPVHLRTRGRSLPQSARLGCSGDLSRVHCARRERRFQSPRPCVR
jgi:hypothetical protein